MIEWLLTVLPVITVSLPGVGDVDVTKHLLAITFVVGVILVTKTILVVVLHRLERLSEKTHTDFDDALIKAVQSIHPWTYSVLALYGGVSLYTLPAQLDLVVTGVVYFAVAWQAIEACSELIEYVVMRTMAKDEDGDGKVDPGAATASEMVTLIARIVLWVLGGLFVLSNLGIEVTSLIAGLGIGGIAVAFALQGVLADLFASFSIYFDKPFRIGDFVVIGADSGTVEKIGIKSTRIRTLQGEELVISNAELTTARVQNFKRMDERRVVTHFGVEYDTPPAVLAEIPKYVAEIFARIPHARLDRAHFSELGDFALLFEVVYYVKSSDYSQYMDIQQQYNLELLRTCAQEGVQFAFPTQTIYTKKSD